VIADAEVTGDPEAMRMTLAAGLARVSALADGARVPSAKASLQKAAAEVEARAQEWRRRFPSPVERLEQLEREQHNIAEAIRESAQFAARIWTPASGGRPRAATGAGGGPAVEPHH
jgi:hypothetical protein